MKTVRALTETESALRGWLQLGWLGKRRITAYGRILAVVSFASLANSYRQAMGRTGSDFLAFWSAARLTVGGAQDRVYDLAASGAIQAELGRTQVFAFVNPPPFLLLIYPLGYLSYAAAWVVWITVTYGLWLIAARRLDRQLGWAIAAFPGALVAAWHAQTGLLTGALMLAASLLLPRRPMLAGLCIGCLVIKPHLAVLYPVALIAGRQWRALLSAALGASLSFALVALLLGRDVLLNYPESWRVSRYLLEHGDAAFYLRQGTIYAEVRLRAGPAAAAAVQAVASLFCIVMVWRAWRGPAGTAWKNAFLLAVIPLATPYLFSYDLAFLVAPVIWLASDARDRPRGGWERALVLCYYLAPLWTRALALPLGANLLPLMDALMVWTLWQRRAFGAPDHGGQDQAHREKAQG